MNNSVNNLGKTSEQGSVRNGPDFFMHISTSNHYFSELTLSEY
jgi:hypothetical protein